MTKQHISIIENNFQKVGQSYTVNVDIIDDNNNLNYSSVKPQIHKNTQMTMTATIGRGKSYYHTIMTITAIIGRSKSYYIV
jgi:hypothetical protein